MTKPFVGIDLGGTNMQIGVLSPAGKIIGRDKKKTRPEDGAKAVIDRLAEGIELACKSAKIKPASLGGIGIGAPGAIDPTTGVVLEAPNLRWNNVPLARTLSKRFGKRVFVDNDVRAAALGEHRLGAGRGCTEMLAAWIGTGIGGGLILRGQLYHGFTNTAGEIGHTTLYPRISPATRSLENNCSRTAIARRIVQMIETNHASLVSEIVRADREQDAQKKGLEGDDLHKAMNKRLGADEIKARVISIAHARGDAVVHAIVDDALEALGIGIASIVTTLGLQRVVVGGGLTEAMGEHLVKRVRDSVRAHAYPTIAKKVDVVGTHLKDNAGLVGAAIMAREGV